jgi:hypothetical protein
MIRDILIVTVSLTVAMFILPALVCLVQYLQRKKLERWYKRKEEAHYLGLKHALLNHIDTVLREVEHE